MKNYTPAEKQSTVYAVLYTLGIVYRTDLFLNELVTDNYGSFDGVAVHYLGEEKLRERERERARKGRERKKEEKRKKMMKKPERREVRERI